MSVGKTRVCYLHNAPVHLGLPSPLCTLISTVVVEACWGQCEVAAQHPLSYDIVVAVVSATNHAWGVSDYMLFVDNVNAIPLYIQYHFIPSGPVPRSDGCGRTGTFLTIYSQIERLKTEQVVDIFQWVKYSRIQRAWLVNSQVGHASHTPSQTEGVALQLRLLLMKGMFCSL